MPIVFFLISGKEGRELSLAQSQSQIPKSKIHLKFQSQAFLVSMTFLVRVADFNNPSWNPGFQVTRP